MNVRHVLLTLALVATGACSQAVVTAGVDLPARPPARAPDSDRAVLILLHEATGGANWTRADNWLTDRPLDEWHGVVADSTGVVGLNLAGNGLTGRIPPELGNLPELRSLNLSGNGLTGPIPPQLGNLSALQALSLGDNGLTGRIPAEFGGLAALRRLDLSENDLAGPIPPALGGLAALEGLSLRDSGLAGPIPAALGQLSRLRTLQLSGNALTGPIPPQLGGLAALQRLDLSGNGLVGGIPPELGRLSALRELHLSGNELTGSMPASFLGMARLDGFRWEENAGLCLPATEAFDDWVAALGSQSGPRCQAVADTPVPTTTYEAGFDCGQAATPVEEAICGNEWIALGDREMTSAYRVLRARSSGEDGAALLASQRAWLSRRNRDCVGDDEAVDDICLARLYSDRLVELARTGDLELGAGPRFDAAYARALLVRGTDLRLDPAARLAMYPHVMAEEGTYSWQADESGLLFEQEYTASGTLSGGDAGAVTFRYSEVMYVGEDGAVWTARHTAPVMSPERYRELEPGRVWMRAGRDPFTIRAGTGVESIELPTAADDVPDLVRSWLDRHPITETMRLPGAQEAATLPEAASLLFTNATVVDGSGAPAFAGDLLIGAGRVVALGPPGAVAGPASVERRDLAGLVLAPGFIDIHNHSTDRLFGSPLAATQLAQGITTIVVGADGSSPWPISDYLARIDELRPTVDVAVLVGHGTVRQAVLGDDYLRTATDAKIANMAARVERGMREGAFGLSTGLEYDPGFYSSTGELVALARVAADHGGFYMTHMRDEEERLMDAVDEAIRIGREAGLPVQISHVKAGNASVWGRAPDVLERIREANASRLDVTADQYPYAAWQSGLATVVPSRMFTNPDSVAKGIAAAGAGAGFRSSPASTSRD